jgi:hypothetical protein
MTEDEVIEVIRDFPIGAKLQLIKTNGDIIEVVLASHETGGLEMKVYDNLVVPPLPPALSVHGGRWGTYRIDIEEIVNIALVGFPGSSPG